jgi:Leucine-rich repeat (LRR) protein
MKRKNKAFMEIPHFVRNDNSYLFEEEKCGQGQSPCPHFSNSSTKTVIQNGAKRSEESILPKQLRRYGLLLFLIFFFPFAGSCQLLDSLTLDTMRACKSLQEAMKDTSGVLKLDLSKQKLKDIPEEIRKLHNLQYLDLSKNKITDVPKWIGEFKDLQFLILSKNKIDSLPPQFGDLTHLKYFTMNRGELHALPHTIGNLKELRYIDLWDDDISHFPYELKYISDNLQVLDLRDVLVNNASQAFLKSILPTTTIYFSPSCPCEK